MTRTPSDPHASPEDDDLEALTRRLARRPIGPSVCFLCARSLDDLGPTSEHVIPRWAQRRFDLWDQRLVLLNDSSIPYRLLTVPCCDECNKYRLQPIETAISSSVERGPLATRQLGIRVLYLWLAKILYGLLYREVSLLHDLASPTGATIIDHQTLADYEGLLFFLQEARGKIETVDFTPGSVFVFRMQPLGEPRLEWDLCDNIDTLFIACRMAEVGLLGVLGDGGAQQPFEEELMDLQDMPLHPFQFRELCAQVSYRSSLFQRTPKHITMQGAPHKVYQMPLGGLSLKPYYADWQPDVYAQYLAHYTGLPLGLVRPIPGKVITWLYDDQLRPRYIEFKDSPQLPGTGRP